MQMHRSLRSGLSLSIASLALIGMVACGDQGLGDDGFTDGMDGIDDMGMDVGGRDAGADAGSDDAGADDDGYGDGDGDGDGWGDGDGERECASVDADIAPVARPTVMLLIDQSGSMNDDFGGQSRWDAVDDTLFDAVDGVVPNLEDSVSFGMALYTSDNGFAGGTCPMMAAVDASFDNASNLSSMFAANSPGGDTPTGEALEDVAKEFSAVPSEGPRVIVLATDGEPDTCAEPNPQNGQDEAVAGAQFAHDLGIETYVVSVGSDTSTAHLQQLANAGRGLEPQGNVDAPFFQALDGTDLQTAFEQITGDVIGCEFELEGNVTSDMACSGNVTLDGEVLDCNGDYEVEGDTLRLTGDACIMLTDGEAHELDASFPCAALAPVG